MHARRIGRFLARSRLQLLFSTPASNPLPPSHDFPPIILAPSSSAPGATQGKHQDPGIVVPPRRLLRTRPCSFVWRSAGPRSARDSRSAVSKGVRCVPLLVFEGRTNVPTSPHHSVPRSLFASYRSNHFASLLTWLVAFAAPLLPSAATTPTLSNTTLATALFLVLSSIIRYTGDAPFNGSVDVVPGGAAGGVGGERPLTEQRLRDILRENLTVENLSISKASASEMTLFLDSAGVSEAETQPAIVLPAGFLPSFAPFRWLGGEDACSVAATLKLSSYLSEAGANIKSAGHGFKVVDVHRRYLLTTQLGQLRLKGGTDAIIIPAGQDPDFATQQARVVIDFKAVKCTFSDIMGQAQAELIAVSSLSHHDVLVVFTDLASFGHALRSEGSKLLVWKDLSPQEVIWLVSDFLTNYCAPVCVAGIDDAHVPGDTASKKRRIFLSEKTHSLLPRSSLLMDQLEAFNTGHWEDYLEGRDLVLSAFESQEHLSYFS